MNKEKLMKMASAVRTGGKGSVRRYAHFFFPLFVQLPSSSAHTFSAFAALLVFIHVAFVLEV
jgi:hypothetical protein